MRLSNSPTPLPPSRTLGPSTQFTPAAPQRNETRARPALRDGFEPSSSAAPKGGDVQAKFREQFSALASDKQQFHDTMRGIFGEGLDSAKAEQYRQQALQGNFDFLPKVEFVNSDVLGSAHGAYDAESGTVLLNKSLQGNPELAAATFVEEAGHHLDAQLNTKDSLGDEGELFRRVLSGEKLTQAQVAEIRAENDKGSIQLHGKSVEVEFWNPLKAIKKAANWVGDKVEQATDWVQDKVEQATDWVGDKVTGAANWVGKTIGKIGNAIKTAAEFMGFGSQPDLKHDGMLVGANNQTYPPNTPLSQIPGVTPRDNPNPTETILYVNGMATDLEWQSQHEMQWIADNSNAKVIGIHNATQGGGADFIQCAKDKLDKGHNPAVDTLADTVYSELKAGRSVHLMGYSQGGLITARALKDVANRLRIEDGMSQAQVEEVMSRLKVETFGGAGAVFPDGPQYVHYVNDKDIVPNAFGLGLPGFLDDLGLDGLSQLPGLTHPGRGAVVHTFSEGENPHGLGATYLDHRVDFDDARAGRF
jgi:hypothetical protein